MKPAQNQISSNGIVAGEVRAWMGRRQWSTRGLATQLGWTETFLGRRLKGTQPFNVDELEAIAQVLDVPVHVFFEGPPGQVRALPGGMSDNP
jgi:hypothetical protein